MSALHVGAAEIRRVEEMTVPLPIAALGPSEAMLARHSHWLSPHFLDAAGQSSLVFQSWIVIVEGRVVVIDPCNGNGRPSPGFPLFDMLDTPYIERFAETGIRPGDVDFVFCTHMHSDHCGWNTTLRDGRYVPTFPNARYLFVQPEFARWNPDRPNHGANPANNGVFERSIRPVVDAGQAELIEPGHRIGQSLRVAAAYGHTAGHCVMELASAGASALFAGDACHHPLQLVEPHLHLHACEDADEAIATRQRLIEWCLAHDALILPAHFAAPHVGRLRRGAEGLSFVAGSEDTVSAGEGSARTP